jgi:hypothetical protein
MSGLAARLFAPTGDASGAWSIIAWWEKRHLPYNFFVGSVGLASAILNLWLWLTYLESPGEDDGFGPVVPAILFGILANVFYTSGWIVEVLALWFRGRGSVTMGPRLFKTGLIFSLVLASLPGLFMFFAVVVHKLL